MNNTIKCLSILCEQNARIDELFNTDGLTAPIYERMNHALSMCGHLLDELQYPTESPAYFERELANLVADVDALFDIAPATFYRRGVTIQLTPQLWGYDCIMTDRLGNDVDWVINAETTTEAIAKAERHLNSAIHYLRGFIVLSTFLERVGEN